MEEKTILVTGIGGNVGQGIIKNLRSLDYKFRIIGTNISSMSSGNYLVDAFYQVPFSFDESDFLTSIRSIIEKEKIDLIIPSTDNEMFVLSNEVFDNVLIASSGKQASSIYLDKYDSFLHHQSKDIPFAISFLPSFYDGQFQKAIAKPRKGRGSRGLFFDFKNDVKLNDEEYLIQELHEGREITIAVYVSYLTNEKHGFIAMERKLENGATVYCKVVTEFDNEINEMIDKVVSNSDIKGSFNIQCIYSEKIKKLIPFEINCRISGTNSIRSSFGFNDVGYIVDELIYNKPLSNIHILEGSAYRTLSDIIYLTNDIQGNIKDDFKLF